MNLEFPRINLEFLEIASAFSKPRNDAGNFRIPRDYFASPLNDKNSKISKVKSQIFLHNFTKFFKHEFCVLCAHFLLARQA